MAKMKTNHRIHLCLAKMSDNGMEQKYIQEAFDSNWVAPLGPNVNAFERDLEHFLSAPVISTEADRRSGEILLSRKQCLKEDFSTPLRSARNDGISVAALSSCTAAIHLALLLLGVSKDDEVLCQTFSFCASSNPVVYCGAKPIFVDSEEETWNMSPELLETAIKKRAIFLATQAEDPYLHYEHETIGYNYRMSNISAGICLPSGPWVTDDDVKYIVETIKILMNC